MVRASVASVFLLAVLSCGCGRAVPLRGEVDSGPSPRASAPVQAPFPTCDEGRWRCAGELCWLAGGTRGLPPAGDDWTCEREILLDENGLWSCTNRAQWVCHGPLTRGLLLGAGRCGWHCAPDPDRLVDQVQCTRELTDHDTPSGAYPYPLCVCADRVDRRETCPRCLKSSQHSTVCHAVRDQPPGPPS